MSTVGAEPASDIAPSQTIRVSNLNEKIKISPLKKALYTTFSQFGPIVAITASRSLTLKGQAWISFSDVASATNALHTLQGFPFFEKPMKIAFAKEKSHVIQKLEGTYKPRPKRPREETPVQEAEPAKARKAAQPEPQVPRPAPAAAVVPNKILLVRGLPSDLSANALDLMLRSLFGSYSGLVEIRPIPSRGLAFVEFSTEAFSIPALQGLHNFKVDDNCTLDVTFAK